MALEFAITDMSGKQRYFDSFERACCHAVFLAATTGTAVNLDVLAHNELDAASWSGEDGVAQYREDPDCSVFDRVVIRAESLGRIA